MAKLYNLARVNTTTAGTGTITLGTAVSGYLTFALAGVADGDVVAYAIKDGSASEHGTGTYTSSGTTLTRTVTKSTNSNNAINLSGSAEVFISPRSQDLVNIGTAGSQLYNFSLAVSAGSSALTIALKDAAGVDPSVDSPVVVDFRNVTGTTGTSSQLQVTSATSLVISSGSTMGVTSSTAFRLWVVLFNDGGTARLGAINCASATSTTATIFPLDESTPASSTAEGGAGAADSAGVFYTGTAVSSKAFRILGYIEWSSSGLTAGTWTTANVNLVQSFGPGIKRPGDELQAKMINTTTGASTTSTSYTSAISTTITPSSAANKVLVLSSGTSFATNGLSSGYITLYRGTTATQLTSARMFNGNIQSMYIPAASVFLDSPNSASSVTYGVGVRGDGTNNCGWGTSGDSGPYGILILRELMC